MATPLTVSAPIREEDYPSSDGKPMAETDAHRWNLTDTIDALNGWFAPEPNVYVAGNMLMYYVPGDKHKHVAPDVFVVKGIPKRLRDYYLVWEEGKAPDVIFEYTSRSTAEEDMEFKFELYRDLLKVQEYFLFDPHDEYLIPALQGYRLTNGEYTRIRPVDGRLPSEVLGLHLERHGWQLRLYDPNTKKWLPTYFEQSEARRQVEEALRREAAARQQADAEVARLRAELEALRQKLPKQS